MLPAPLGDLGRLRKRGRQRRRPAPAREVLHRELRGRRRLVEAVLLVEQPGALAVQLGQLGLRSHAGEERLGMVLQLARGGEVAVAGGQIGQLVEGDGLHLGGAPAHAAGARH